MYGDYGYGHEFLQQTSDFKLNYHAAVKSPFDGSPDLLYHCQGYRLGSELQTQHSRSQRVLNPGRGRMMSSCQHLCSGEDEYKTSINLF